MSTLVTLIQIEAWLFLGAVAVIILHKLVSGGINIGEAQLNRAQLLISVIAAAAYYLSMIEHDAVKLPELPDAAIVMLGGSNLIYLANKFTQLWPAITGADRST